MSIPPPAFRFFPYLPLAGRSHTLHYTSVCFELTLGSLMNRTHRNWSHGQSGPRRSGRRSWHYPHELDHHGCWSKYFLSFPVSHTTGGRFAGLVRGLGRDGTRKIIATASNRFDWTLQPELREGCDIRHSSGSGFLLLAFDFDNFLIITSLYNLDLESSIPHQESGKSLYQYQFQS